MWYFWRFCPSLSCSNPSECQQKHVEAGEPLSKRAGPGHGAPNRSGICVIPIETRMNGHPALRGDVLISSALIMNTEKGPENRRKRLTAGERKGAKCSGAAGKLRVGHVHDVRRREKTLIGELRGCDPL